MLQHLYVKNFAIIDEIQIDFGRGLNILTGETGAGKSILIGALELIIGERANADLVRQNTNKAIIEAIFSVDKSDTLTSLLSENQIDWMDSLIIRREISSSGQSRCFINDSPATLKLLKEIGESLVDLHGQHEHQSLLRVNTHCKLLDDFGGLSGIVREYQNQYRSLQKLFDELQLLKSQEKILNEKKDLLSFQINEIDAVNPQSNEEIELSTELNILENSEKIFEQTEQLYEMLYESDHSVYEKLVLARNRLESLADIDPKFKEYRSECQSAEAVIAELAKFLQGYNSRIEFDPEKLETIRNRLGELSLLKKKYGGTIESILDYRKKIGTEFKLAENFQDSINHIKIKIDEKRQSLSEIAERLSTKRRDTARKISRLILKELQTLGIPNAQFEVNIETIADSKKELNDETAYIKFGEEYYHAFNNGMDDVEFFISTNLGEEPKPLAKVASGGEVSRIMLALKSVLAKSERLPLLIFDEIDAGVSGRIAQAVGKSLKNLSSFHQIIAITHLPQIAGLADSHYVVEKVEEKKRTITHVRKLDDEERVREVARLLSGEEITDAGIIGAKELMKIE